MSDAALPVPESSKPKPAASSSKGASVPASVFNLAKNIMGAGAISLPAGIVAIGDVKSAVLPAVGILTVMGSLSGYSFSVIGQECARYNAKSFEEVWASTIGEKSMWMISCSIATTTFLACLAYSMIIGDLISALAVTAGMEGLLAKRSTAILAITGGIVTPLCFLKSLAALSFTSLLGVLGVIFSTVVMGLRFFDGSYLPTGMYFESVAPNLKPLFGVKGYWKLDHMAFVLLSCLSTAFLSHFNAVAFYNQLKDRSVARFNTVVRWGFSTAVVVFAGMMAFGFGTFGANTSGNVFVNYSALDNLATVCRLATGFSIIFTYPLAFVGLRSTAFNLFKVKNPTPKQSFLLTSGLLTSITGLALVLQDLGFVAAFTGSLMGSLIIYIFPALMRLKSLSRDPATKPRDKLSAYGLLGIGSVLGVVGIAVSFLKQFTKVLG